MVPGTFSSWTLCNSQEGGCCDNDVHEIFKCLGEIALTSAYVCENADGSLETWNCAGTRNSKGSMTVIPAESVVSRVHFNLRASTRIQVTFAAEERDATLPAGMTWFGPGGVPEEIRP